MPPSDSQNPAAKPPPKPSPPVDVPPDEPGAEEALFRALVNAGCDPAIAYTADRRTRTMASEFAAAQIQPIVAELRQIRETMVSKADLAGFATKADLAGFATKADLTGFATKADLAGFATKADLHALSERMVKWVFGALMAQTALLIALLIAFVRLLN